LNEKNNYQFTSNNSNTWTYTYDKDEIIIPPIVNKKEFPKIMERLFIEIPGLARSKDTHPQTDCLNYICRGRLLVLERLKALNLYKIDEEDHKAVYLRDNDAQQILDKIEKNQIMNLKRPLF